MLPVELRWLASWPFSFLNSVDDVFEYKDFLHCRFIARGSALSLCFSWNLGDRFGRQGGGMGRAHARHRHASPRLLIIVGDQELLWCVRRRDSDGDWFDVTTYLPVAEWLREI